MPKKPKTGPPYNNIPDDVYVVVTNPWGMSTNPRQRGQSDINRIASWAQFAFQQAGLAGGRIPAIECVYGMGTRDEVILQFAAGTDIIPLLGEHRWASFAKYPVASNDHKSTHVFIYNWRNNGDPAKHGWIENFPRPVSLDSVPAKSPYPAPSWVTPPPTLSNFVFPIPRPPTPPPIPNHGPDQEQQSTSPPILVSPKKVSESESGEQPAEPSTSHFMPYQPPVQHPSHAPYLNPPQNRPVEPPSSPSSFKFVKKLDPYELEEDALSVLRSPNPEPEDSKEVKSEDITLPLPFVKVEWPDVKTEGDAEHNVATGSDSRYNPSQDLIDAFNSLGQPTQAPPSTRSHTHDPRGQPNPGAAYLRFPSALSLIDGVIAPKSVPPASSGYRPSAELEAEINAMLQGKPNATSSSLSGKSSVPRVVVKREYEDDTVTVLGGERKKIKVEEY